jgi:hypothetical protein
MIMVLNKVTQMRVRTEKKRQEIIRIAAELFDELGYERTSMSTIASRVGGSKTTLYGYCLQRGVASCRARSRRQ